MQYELTSDGLYQNGTAIHRRSGGHSLREFLTQLTDKYYEGEDYRFGVVDDLGLACLAVTAACLKGEKIWQEIPPSQRALVFATQSGSLMTDLEFQSSLDRGGRTSPRVFVQTLPNMAAGQVAACYAIRGEHFVLVQSSSDAPARAETVAMCLAYGGAKACLSGWAEYSAKGLNVEVNIVYAEANAQAPVSGLLTSARS